VQVIQKPSAMVELNSAGIDDLVSLKGIGKVYAERIIKYRERLGGYASVEQLKEVYGFNESLFNSVSNQVYADVSLLRCIQLNKADYKTLLSHPYLEKAEVEAILSYREMVDQIVSADELLKQKVLSRERYQQIKPYLCAD
ncbi:MAG TPA: helix-hairpin-helix domain-containing protein, partial [Bacteroidales bacterium]|nr:helix-hairpin-helix domain-containing protein [Bacteroidales bacterium]